MEKNQALLLASGIFAIISLLHLLRSILSWEVSVNGFVIPIWASYIAFAVAGFLAWTMHSASKK